MSIIALLPPWSPIPPPLLTRSHEHRQPRSWSSYSSNVRTDRLARPPYRNNDCFTSQCSGVDHNSISLDGLSGLVARLILQNHLTRLGDAGCHGGALWGCGSSPPQPAPHCHGAAPANNRCQLPCVHTCPGATQPYVGTNNVFVIPANLVYQQPQVGATGPVGTGNLNNINMVLSGLGLGLGGISSGCGGGLSLPHGFNAHLSGAGLVPQINLNRFSCPSCNGHF